ncbi:cupin domain-containing protein [Rhizobium ruizarguesonis]|uniref:cupin domain-containing protein n=1 Tax=Rhizobium ruizarguesonis TaxID=2081791 RepID=UPI0004627317|nr:cupin domain-containing protein [Rhizobium ruizarguesonis]MBY5851589.1 cupin domain-containing protein [Rhizobium leguminosarum]NKL13352.1 cupin domain-containing protein [Rhizobium leguminosarum bv. viciae]MBY5873408.1 cupin domain-containing protein [Rhizobium leguminosarum]MBY5892426.1 cupin domain-containing protein [Rhizobium leguminosarum]NEH38233.1 cupin domain-containing protein [Rhizobium ruizarguesonis]
MHKKSRREQDLREAIIIAANDGVTTNLSAGVACTARVKVSPLTHAHSNFSIVGVDIHDRGRVRSHIHELNERVIICFGGAGTVQSSGRRHPVSQGTFVFCGRGVEVQFEQQGSKDLRLSIISFPPGPEARFDLFPVGGEREFPANIAAILGVKWDERPAEQSQNDFIVVQDDEGEDYWQAAPSVGFVSIKLAPPAIPLNYFCAASQLLEPGAKVRSHGHQVSEEIVIVTQGSGLAVIEDEQHNIAEGDLIVLPPKVMHHFENNTDKPLRYGGVFLPPSVESALRATGVRKMPGVPRPTDIPRNPETERMLVERYGFIINGIS